MTLEDRAGGPTDLRRSEGVCNAWNHPVECRCGWGGEGSLGGGRGGYGGGFGGMGEPLSYDSYTNPNARCPVCGAGVIFYQSPEGGRVFFDPPIGPPWPKHPCTDRRAGGRSVSLNSTAAAERLRALEEEGWEPFVVTATAPEYSTTTVTGYLVRTGETTCFVIYSRDWWGGRAPAYIRRSPTNPRRYEIATLKLDSLSRKLVPVLITTPWR
jgi:hypothetical protein